MDKKAFLFKSLLIINVFFLLLQLFAMDILNLGLNFPILSLGIPLLCFINLIFLVYWFLRFKWPFFLFFLVFAISFEAWQSLYQFKSKGIITSKGLTLMSYNVRSFNRFNWLDIKEIPSLIANYIEIVKPDVVCFQEYNQDQAPRFTNYPYKIFKPYVPNGIIGSCIVSKYPLVNSKIISFKASSNGGMQSDLVFKQDTLRLYNLHFESLRINSKDTLLTSNYSKQFRSKIKNVFETQKQQVLRFNKLAKSNTFPEIICTDLNNNAFSESYKNLSKNRLDTFKEKGQGFGSTYQFPYFPLRIDYIFTTSNITILDYITHEVKFSDHKPISVVLQFP
jgi:endonuclease/exonuclease/phosphatase family metal-dependent hydrolase